MQEAYVSPPFCFLRQRECINTRPPGVPVLMRACGGSDLSRSPTVVCCPLPCQVHFIHRRRTYAVPTLGYSCTVDFLSKLSEGNVSSRYSYPIGHERAPIGRCRPSFVLAQAQQTIDMSWWHLTMSRAKDINRHPSRPMKTHSFGMR